MRKWASTETADAFIGAIDRGVGPAPRRHSVEATLRRETSPARWEEPSGVEMSDAIARLGVDGTSGPAPKMAHWSLGPPPGQKFAVGPAVGTGLSKALPRALRYVGRAQTSARPLILSNARGGVGTAVKPLYAPTHPRYFSSKNTAVGDIRATYRRRAPTPKPATSAGSGPGPTGTRITEAPKLPAPARGPAPGAGLGDDALKSLGLNPRPAVAGSGDDALKSLGITRPTPTSAPAKPEDALLEAAAKRRRPVARREEIYAPKASPVAEGPMPRAWVVGDKPIVIGNNPGLKRTTIQRVRRGNKRPQRVPWSKQEAVVEKRRLGAERRQQLQENLLTNHRIDAPTLTGGRLPVADTTAAVGLGPSSSQALRVADDFVDDIDDVAGGAGAAAGGAGPAPGTGSLFGKLWMPAATIGGLGWVGYEAMTPRSPVHPSNSQYDYT